MAEFTISEEWRIVANFSDYEVSNLGRIRRRVGAYQKHRFSETRKIVSPAGFILAQPPDKDGYRTVCLCDGSGRHFTRRVAPLVCAAFHGVRPTPKHEAAHGDGDKDNNHEDNLRWAISLENHSDRERHGTIVRGTRCHKAKLNENDVKDIRNLLSDGVSPEYIAIRFAVSKSTIRHIANRRSWAWLC